MSAPTKLAGFGAGLALLLGGGAVAGATLGPDRGDVDRAAISHTPAAVHGGHEEPQETTTTMTTNASTSDGAHEAHGATAPAGASMPGLAVSERGLRLDVRTPELRRGTRDELRFAIVDADSGVVRAFDTEHTKRMHVIVVRRDLTGFQHLHPRQAADGSWRVPVRIDDAGSYPVFADFSHEDEAMTLASDLRVDGPADLRPLPAPATSAVSDGGYEVRLDAGAVRAGDEAELRFAVTKDGRPVHVEPYLGAGGHLVALREGDLAFLHVHPTDHGPGATEPPSGEHDDAIGIGATFPSVGRYRLFLQFKHDGRVQTVAFIQEVS